MSINQMPRALRVHIGFFGSTNVGKSSLVNAVTCQSLSLVSPVSGTTTDPVKKAMELLPIGPVVIIDTPGFDDKSELGKLRVERTKKVLFEVDLAVLVCDASVGFTESDRNLIELFKSKNVKYVTVFNKSDTAKSLQKTQEDAVYTCAKNGDGIENLKKAIVQALSDITPVQKPIISDLVKRGDLVIMVIPIDSSAPKGRIILPQQQVLREGLDVGAHMLAVKENELENALGELTVTPKLIITDSQVFGKVMKIVPQDIPLTSFSILMARYKGFLEEAVRGANVLDKLNDGDKILISEGCTHHRQCEDIGTVKLPRWIKEYCKKDIELEFTQGSQFPEDLSKYSLIIHCGGCMLTEREVSGRRERAKDEGVPFTNYGTVIAKINGILERSTRVFKTTV